MCAGEEGGGVCGGEVMGVWRVLGRGGLGGGWDGEMERWRDGGWNGGKGKKGSDGVERDTSNSASSKDAPVLVTDVQIHIALSIHTYQSA